MEIGGNIGTISSRSFGVVDKVNSDLSIIGITIDNYANVNNNKKLVFYSFPNNVPIPTFITILAQSKHQTSAQQFVRFLLSTKGQLDISPLNTGKHPVVPVNDIKSKYYQFDNVNQAELINYDILLKRQELVKQLFDIAITFRLEQLKDTWQLLYATENKIGTKLTVVRQLLTQMPIDACANQKAHIKIDKIETETELILYIQDNGIGWPCKDAERLLMPFTSNKKIGLGVGLSLSQSIMQQNKGDLYIASTLNGHALIILKFIKS